MIRRLGPLLFFSAAMYGADAGRPVEEAQARFESAVAKLPANLRIDFRFDGANILLARYPALAAKLVRADLEEMRAASEVAISGAAIRTLAAVDAEAAAALAPRIKIGLRQALIRALTDTNHPELALKVFRSTADEFDAKTAPPIEIWQFLNAIVAVTPASKRIAAESYERVAKIVAARNFGDDPKNTMHATVAIAGKPLETANAKDSLLVIAGGRLRAIDAERFESAKALFAKWDLNGALSIRGLVFGPARTAPEASRISGRMSELRGNLSDEARSRLAIDLAGEIRAMGGEQRASLALNLENLATEGDLGPKALEAVAETLATAMHETPSASGWIALADLVHYEHVTAPVSDPALNAALAMLDMRDTIVQDAGFSLTALDGKSYSLESLRGKVVLLNFWATWCPPCRKEMPDMERLHQKYGDKVVVLAVSDEDRATVEGFIEKQKYTFPVLLDPDRKVNKAFGVEGIPKSFVFDRNGKLAAQAIDMRTERQFIQMLKSAGLD